MALPTLLMTNKESGVSVLYFVAGGTAAIALQPIATNTILGNFTGGSALPVAQTVQAVANKLPAKTGVAAISAESPAVASSIALSTSNTYTDAAVNSAVNTALTAVNVSLNAAITQLNAILAAVKVIS